MGGGRIEEIGREDGERCHAGGCVLSRGKGEAGGIEGGGIGSRV